MHWLQSLDIALFHFGNRTLSNPVFDWVMPVLSGKGVVMQLFAAALLVLASVALVRGGARARICALLLFIVVAAGDPLIIGTIKNAVGRARPCLALPDVVERLGCSDSGSMPSAHSANWFAAAMVMFLFYRRSGRMLFPLAAAVAFSRVYCGVHYPSDVAAGAVLGCGYAIALVVGAQMLWHTLGKKLFPSWHAQTPNLLPPAARIENPEIEKRKSQTDWRHLGYVLIGVTLVARWLYLASGLIHLSGDEAYQWLWSKHLALSYYSKPPGIAYIQWAGTHLFGDTDLGVRFFSPVFAAILSVVCLRFIARQTNARHAFLFLLATLATPLFIAGSILMTIDPPLVLCWMWATLAGWRAVQPDARTRDWLVVGLATGLGFLCKYSALFLPVCLGIYFCLQPAARPQLRRGGPWLALAIFFLCTLPVIIWNRQHGWATVHHVAGNAGLTNGQWHFNPAYFFEFSGAVAGLLNPIFFFAMLWACFAFWKRRQENPLLLYLFCLGAPVFFGYWLYTLHSRVLPNWIAPAAPPLFCLTAIFWYQAKQCWKPWFAVAMILGLLAAAALHDTDLTGKLIAKLPGDADPSRRVRGWPETAKAVEAERAKFDPNAFIIAKDYAGTGLNSFYSAPARAAATTGRPLVYCLEDSPPSNQILFWDEYNYPEYRRGENAIFVRRLEPGKLESGWFWKWLRHEKVVAGLPELRPAPDHLTRAFESVTNLGVREIRLKDGRIFQRVEIFGCYHLK
jgi:membrane-associated phospholipid phosphatase